MSGKVFVRKRALPGRNFVRKGFCQEAGSARKEFCQKGFLSGTRKEFCQEGFLSGSGLCQEGGVSFGVGCETVRRLSVFVLGRAGGQSALELGVKLFVVAVVVCFCFGAGGGPVSFGVGCETVRRRRRRLFLFWGGRGASQLWSWV